MMWLHNRKTMTKLVLAFGMLAVLIAIVGYQGMRGMAAIDESVDVIYEKHAIGLDAVRGAQIHVLDISREVRNVLLDLANKNSSALDRRREYIQKATAEFDDRFKKYEQTIVLAATREKAADVPRMFQALRAEQDKLMALAADGKLSEAYAGLGAARNDADAIEAAMQGLVVSKRDLMKEAAADANRAYQSARAFIVALVAAAVVLAIGLGVFIARVISRPLVATVALLQDMAQGEGDLTKRLEVGYQDEVGELARWFNAFMDKLHDIIAQAKGVSLHMAEASTQLSAATEQMASGAQQQASSLEETAASLEEITGTVKQNADNARQANQLAAGSRGVAEKGGQVVAAAVAAMGEINQSSRKVADIIATIDEIAFQTNLLALNAAVEAARAGEQGRGFAVVAAEVRNLAQRSAGAAKEIKGLIQDSVGKVEAGSALVNQAGQTLDEIVTSVKRVTDIIAEIAAASQEQSTGVEQVNRAVTQMDQVVQGNAAQSEELSSTAQALAGQAGDLQALVGRFKLAGDGRAAALGAAPARPALPRSAAAKPGRLGAARAPAPRPVAKRITEAATARASAKHDHAADDGFEEF